MGCEFLTAHDVGVILAGLSIVAIGLYYFLPDDCWMSERTIAKALKIHTREISHAKKELEAAGLIKIIHEQNKPNRTNPIHRIVKVEYLGLFPIQDEYQWVLRARENVLSPQNIELETENILPLQNIEADSEIISPNKNLQVSMNWELLKNYSAAEINRMSTLEKVELYMEVGFLVLPTNYPIFSPTGKLSCSCRNENCNSIAKHPAVKRFKDLTPETYQKRRKGYLQRFKQDRDLNIGFKPFGFSVLDVDYKHGGEESLAYLRDEFNGLDETLTAVPSDGLHLYSSTVGLNQSVGLLGAGLDIRSDKTNGFIVAPGSIHRSGVQYQWQEINDLQPIPDEWLCENDSTENRAENKKGKKIGRSIKQITIPARVYPGYFIPEGQRYDTLFKFAARERGRGGGEQHIYNVLETIRDTYCEESKNPENAVTNEELSHIAKSVVSNYLTNAQKLSSAKAA